MKWSGLLTTLSLVFVTLGALQASSPWNSTQTIPMFRGTAAQESMLRKRTQSTFCISNLRRIGTAAKMYQIDNNGHNPSAWQEFTNQIEEANTLYCPADTAHPVQTNWANVNFSAISYQIITPDNAVDLTKVFVQCAVHGNRVYVDGSSEERRPYELEIPGSMTNGGLVFFLPALQSAKRRALQIECLNRCKSIGYAGLDYALYHNVFPTSFSQVTNELVWPRNLFCPSDVTNSIPTNFSQLNYSTVDFTIVSPGVSIDADPTTVFAKCRLHGTYVTIDGAGHAGTNGYPKTIVGHPMSQTAEPGATVTFSVLTGTNAGLAPFNFQWRKKQPFDAAGDPFTNNVVLIGATNQSLVFTNVQTTNEGYYDVIVRDSAGGYQESYMAYLRVEALVTIKTNSSWQALSCMNNLNGIAIAGRLFNNDTGLYPTSLADHARFLGWPLSVYCPSDPNRIAPTSWAAVDFTNTSYLYYTNVDSLSTNALAVCKVHGFAVQGIGSLDLLAGKAKLQTQTATNATTLSWTNAACSLQMAPSLGSTFTNVPGATSPFTIPITGSQRFFQLRQH